MIKRIKRLWQLSKKDPKALELISSMTKDQIDLIPEINEGDGKAVFFDEGFEEEAKQLEKEDNGTDIWYKRILKL